MQIALTVPVISKCTEKLVKLRFQPILKHTYYIHQRLIFISTFYRLLIALTVGKTFLVTKPHMTVLKRSSQDSNYIIEIVRSFLQKYVRLCAYQLKIGAVKVNLSLTSSNASSLLSKEY